MFGFIKKAFTTIYQKFTTKAQALFARAIIDEEALVELEQLLISADAGIHTTRTLIKNLKESVRAGRIQQGQQLEQALEQQLIEMLQHKQFNPDADIYLLVGINGSGKTTFAGKLGYLLKQAGKKVLLVAGDTFRAAATEQLASWAHQLSIDISRGKENQDPASVVYTSCEQFKTGHYTALIVDTAGRLQTKVNLMKELEKIKRIIEKVLPDKKISTLLIIDAMLGQNSFEQAKMFNESTRLDGIVLTKMDGTAKGGIVFSITQELKIPIAFVSFGEKPEQLALFNSHEYVAALLKE